MRRVVRLVSTFLLVITVTLEARADPNPNFTPVDLVRQSHVIAVVTCDAPDTQGRMTVRVKQILKEVLGRAPKKPFTVDLGAPGEGLKELTDAAVGMVKRATKNDAPILFFYGDYQEKDHDWDPNVVSPLGHPGERGYLHVDDTWLGAKWFRLWRPEGEQLELVSLDDYMQLTWMGSTDMLLRCVKYILTDPWPDVPPYTNTAWRSAAHVATFPHKVRSLSMVDLAGDGRYVLFAASDGGDRLLVHQKEKEPLTDVTTDRRLLARSQVATWADFNGDGRLDLASWDGRVLSLWPQEVDGTFRQKKVNVDLKDGCIGLAPLDVGTAGRPGLLISTTGSPVLLLPGKDGALEPRTLPPLPVFKKTPGSTGACIVADFDGDGVGDIVQPFANCLLFYKGRGGGDFHPPKVTGGPSVDVHWDHDRAPVVGKASVGDFDQDGRLDLFVPTEDFPELYQNLGSGRFEDCIQVSGEISYRANPNIIGCQVRDVNNDGRQDIFAWYSDQHPLVYCNRGFRSFSQTHDVEFYRLEPGNNGLQAATMADLNGDGVQDCVLVTPKGEAWVVYGELREGITEHKVGPERLHRPSARVVLALGKSHTGPLTVTGWAGKRCLGAWNVVAGSTEAWFARGGPGPIELRWQFPGGKPQKKEVILESRPVRLILKPEK